MKMDNELWGHCVEILSIAAGESRSLPMALVELRPHSDPLMESVVVMFSREQCVRLRDTLDRFLCNPDSWLYMPMAEQIEFQEPDDDEHDSEEIVPLLVRFAELSDDSEESQELATRLNTVKLVLTAFLLFFGDFQLKLLAACALARIDPSEAQRALPTLITGLKDDDEMNRAMAAVACRSLGPLASPAVPALLDVLETTDDEIGNVRRFVREALAKITRE
jgi:hypothetical protein